MKRLMTKLFALLLVLTMVLPGMSVSADQEVILNYSGKTVIIATNDVHGNIEGYSYVKGLRTYLESAGAEVITVDVGDFSQGTPYVSENKGKNAITLMNLAGYDIVTLGNHEFDYGWKQLKSNLKKAKFKVLCADVFNSKGKTIYEASTVWTTEDGLKIGFFGLETPEAMTKSNPKNVKGLKFLRGEELYKAAQNEIDKLKESSDIVICLAHLGLDADDEPNRSTDIYNYTEGIDLMFDGHSHSVMTEGPDGEFIQSTGTKFENIGIVVIDNKTKTIEDRYNLSMDFIKENIKPDRTVSKKAKKIIKNIDAKFGQVFAKSEVDLNGEKIPNRSQETNLSDLICDAMEWQVLSESELLVDRDHVVTINNGGCVRASLGAGDITMNDIKTVLPFGNTLTVVYVKGSQLLEALEASTYLTPEALGGFPQVAGIKYTINTAKKFRQGEQYADSTYYAPKKCVRVTIQEINGQPFNKKDTYAVITNIFCSDGGDTYYVFGQCETKFDTGMPQDEAVVNYIENVLGGVIGEDYAQPQGRITVK